MQKIEKKNSKTKKKKKPLVMPVSKDKKDCCWLLKIKGPYKSYKHIINSRVNLQIRLGLKTSARVQDYNTRVLKKNKKNYHAYIKKKDKKNLLLVVVLGVTLKARETWRVTPTWDKAATKNLKGEKPDFRLLKFKSCAFSIYEYGSFVLLHALFSAAENSTFRVQRTRLITAMIIVPFTLEWQQRGMNQQGSCFRKQLLI